MEAEPWITLILCPGLSALVRRRLLDRYGDARSSDQCAACRVARGRRQQGKPRLAEAAGLRRDRPLP